MGIIGLYILRVIAYLICLAVTAGYVKEIMRQDIHLKINVNMRHSIDCTANDLDINMRGGY